MPLRSDLRLFLLLAFGISWCIAGIGALTGVDATSGLAYSVVALGFMLGPALAAILLVVFFRRKGWGALGLGFGGVRWGPMAWTALYGLALVPVTLLVCWCFGNLLGFDAFGDVALTQARVESSVVAMAEAAGQNGELARKALGGMQLPGAVWLLLFLAMALGAAVTLNVPAMLGEELGWRGVMYALLDGWPPRRRIVFTGVVWGLWHAPLIAMGHNYGEHRLAGIALMVVFCMLLAVLFDRARTMAASVWAAVLLHGLINGSAGAFALFTQGGHPLVASPAGLAGMVAIALMIAILALSDRARAR
ncbi:MAG: CPBP family intramembrane metalloprotease [Flavobacteriales bacterium]|nr:CPBP family intramembrane metalloprotease [Flavobacteriales bacterium]